MNTTLTVRKTGDTNQIPVMYRVVESQPAATAATTYCVLECIRVGWDTVAHYNLWKSHKNYYASPTQSLSYNPLGSVNPPQGDYTRLMGHEDYSNTPPLGQQGTLGSLEIQALNAIVAYELQGSTTALVVPGASGVDTPSTDS